MIKINSKYKLLFSTDTRITVIIGGRGSGKSFAVSSFLCMLSFEKQQRILYTRQTMTSAHLSIIPEFQEKIELMGAEDKFTVNKTEIVNTDSNSEILFKGIQSSSGSNTANLKSLSGITTWVIDEAEEMIDESVFDKINLSIRTKGVQNRVIIILNPAKVSHWIFKRFFENAGVESGFNGIHDGVTYIHSTYLDNIKNLDESFLEEMNRMMNSNLKKYNHVALGQWASTNEELALWNDAMIESNRVAVAPNMKRIVVAIDPAVTATDKSDLTGIIVAGIGFDNCFYPLDDASGTYTPTKWAEMAVMMYRKWKADRVIGEVNNGGDLIETVLRTVDKNIPYTSVHASRSKLSRAEPVSALYEQGRGRHVGKLLELEYEMCSWESKAGEKSPNRIDALVWAAAELMPELDINATNRMKGSLSSAMRGGR